MEKSNLSFLLMNVVIPFAIIPFILIVFGFTGIAYAIELFVLLLIMIVLTLSMHSIYYNKKWGWTIISATLIFLLVDLFVVVLFRKAISPAYVVSIIFSIAGIVIALLNLKDDIPEREESIGQKYEATKEYYEKSEKIGSQPEAQHESMEELKDEIKEEVKGEVKQEVKEEVKDELRKETSHVLAKSAKRSAAKKITAHYVGSAETKKFHTVKCNWVRLMKRKNRIYFNSKRRALAAGFKPHGCAQ